MGAVSQQGVPLNATLPRPYDNLGIPGANAADQVDLKVANPAGNTANRFAALVLRNFPGAPFEGMSAVDEANLLNPDLVTVWVGPNDVLGAALSGAAIEGVTLTPIAVFEAKYTQIMTGLRATGRTVVALNIPDVASIPFTTTVPAILVNPDDPAARHRQRADGAAPRTAHQRLLPDGPLSRSERHARDPRRGEPAGPGHRRSRRARRDRTAAARRFVQPPVDVERRSAPLPGRGRV